MPSRSELISKMKIELVLICLSIVFISANDETREYAGNLIAVAVAYRHGDRSPSKSFPNDQFFDRSYWPMGYAQLTQKGMHRQYMLGKWFRARYSSFLSDTYTPDEIYVYSTDSDRTLMSAASNLAGLYPPRDFQVWNAEIPWQPIPVHTKDKDGDGLITEKSSCRKFAKLFRKEKEKRYAELEEEYSDVLQYIGNNTGWNKITITRVKELQKNLDMYDSYNDSFVPKWVKDRSVIDYMAAVVYEVPTSTTDLARLRIGPFYDYLFRYFDKFVRPSSGDKRKFLMISAHDSSLSSILGGMGAFKMIPIRFADSVLWELRRKIDGGYYMNVLYKRGGDLEKLEINGCNFDCDYDDFKNSLSNITVSKKEWHIECNNKRKHRF